MHTYRKYPGHAAYRAMLLTTALEHALALGVHTELLWSVSIRIYHQLSALQGQGLGFESL